MLKCCTQYVSKFGKCSSSHSTGKCQFSFQLQTRVMPKDVETTVQLHSFQMEVRLYSKSFNPGFHRTRTKKLQYYMLYLEKAEEPEIKLPTFIESWKKQRNSRKTSVSVSLTTLKTLIVWIKQTGTFLKRRKQQNTISVS